MRTLTSKDPKIYLQLTPLFPRLSLIFFFFGCCFYIIFLLITFIFIRFLFAYLPYSRILIYLFVFFFSSFISLWLIDVIPFHPENPYATPRHVTPSRAQTSERRVLS
uniref:Uncharacterized protein n=1 Tax=Trypanosoma congolense (strain IL3000) TaxID=1068625 RepID=G0UMH5_TRYCI|nr:hypothetical protein, unlikely [Trypanosoma congolense IL3000]